MQKEHVFITDSDPAALMRLTVALASMRFDITGAEQPEPLAAAASFAKSGPAAMIIALRGTENIADVRALLEGAEATKFIFLVRERPPKAVLSRVARAHGATILSKDEAALVLAATLIAMLVPRSRGVA